MSETHRDADDEVEAFDLPPVTVGESGDGKYVLAAMPEFGATTGMTDEQAEMLVEQLTTILRVRKKRNKGVVRLVMLKDVIVPAIVSIFDSYKPSKPVDGETSLEEPVLPYTCHRCGDPTDDPPATLADGSEKKSTCRVCRWNAINGIAPEQRQ